MAQWTSEQLSAINFRGGSAIVSAAAGSGKTAVLVERILHLITDTENKINADEIAVATFTNKAAGELRQRLITAVAALESERHDEYLREQMIRLEDADISTISSFCLGILREYSAAAGVSPDFSVLEQSETQLMRSNAMKSAMRRFYEEFDEREKALLFGWFAETRDTGIEDAVTAYYDFTRNLPDIDGWIEKQLKSYKNPKKGFGQLVGAFYSELSDMAKRAGEAAEEMAALAEFDSMSAFCEGYVNNYAELAAIEDFSEPSALEMAESLLHFDGGRLPSKKGVDTSEIKALRNELDELTEEMLLKLRISATAYDDCGGDMLNVLTALTKLMRVFEGEYSELKRAANGVDFSDIEQFTLAITADGELARKIGERYSCIIVDEFQDSNDAQYEIFRRISRGGENLFFVGDIKQSIYRFRGTNPDVFARLTRSRGFKKLIMSRNFRSNRFVIDAVNDLFMGLMVKLLGGVDYDKSAMLREGAAFYGESDADDANIAELNIVAGAEEYEYVAARIAEMLQTGFRVTDKDGTRRPCRFSDFAVLMRSDSSKGKLFREALAAYGIPAVAKDEGEYTGLAEIDLVLNLLTIIDNPYNNAALTAVLMSPLYMFTAEEMGQIRLNGGKKLYSGVIAAENSSPAAARFLSDYRRYRRLAADSSVTELVRSIYDEGGLLSAMALQFKGAQRVANMRMLLTYADAFGKRGGTLSDFLVYIGKIKKSSLQLTPASMQSGENTVSVMSIHASKGLEFPICFVCGTNIQFNLRDSYPRILFDITAGIGLVSVDTENAALLETLPHKAIADIIRANTISECMRLLYVAVTRAREKLIITVRGERGRGGIRAAADNSFLSWIEKSGAVLKQTISRRIINEGDMPSAERVGEVSAEDAAPDMETAEKIRAEFSRVYKYGILCEIPSKFTATELGVELRENILSEATEKISVFPRKPSFMQPDRRLSGKKRGDAYHKVMELLDFSGGNAAAQLVTMLERGSVSQAEFDCIKADEIQRFLDSPLCRRAVKSEKVYREFPVFAEISPSRLGADIPDDCTDKPIVQGIADMFFIEDGGIILVDYKTNHNASPAQLIETYGGQMKLYAEILSDTFGLPTREALLYSFEQGELGVDV